MNIEEATWVEVREALSATDLLIVPLGATETYGPHLPTGTEKIIGDHLGRALAERTRALLAPTVPISCSGNLERFVGNFYVTPAALKAYLGDICDRAATWGVKRVFFLNVHGPNLPVIEEISRDLMWRGVRCAQIDFWRFTQRLSPDLLKGGPLATGHAGEMATSIMLALRPDLVRPTEFSTVSPAATLSERYPDVQTYVPWHEVTPTGHTGDPSPASAEAGQAMLERVLARLEAFLLSWE